MGWEQLGQARYGWAAATVGVVVVVGVAAGWRRFRRRPDAAELERLRRSRVNQVGRLTGGEIVDILDDLPAATPSDAAPRVLVYRYKVRGVQYEASQDIAPLLAGIHPRACLPGLPAEIKFDPANPGNSIVLCETWSGLR
ncbi:MAG: hypothetical protein ACRD2E_11595 [Terriglobales bacterium]